MAPGRLRVDADLQDKDKVIVMNRMKPEVRDTPRLPSPGDGGAGPRRGAAGTRPA